MLSVCMEIVPLHGYVMERYIMVRIEIWVPLQIFLFAGTVISTNSHMVVVRSIHHGSHSMAPWQLLLLFVVAYPGLPM